MADLDVALRLRLINQLGNGGRQAKRELEQIAAAAKRLDGAKGRGLAQELGRTTTAARQARQALGEIDRQKLVGARGQIAGLSGDAGRLRRQLGDATGALGRLGAARLARLRSEAGSAERGVRQVGQAALAGRAGVMQLDNVKLGKLKAEVEGARKKITALKEDVQAAGGINGPAGTLSGTLGSLAGAAGRAWTALAAYASVDNIVRGLAQMEEGYRKLDAQISGMAVTAELYSDPAGRAAIRKNATDLAVKYGYGSAAPVLAAQDKFLKEGISFESSLALLEPNIRGARAMAADPLEVAAAQAFAKRTLGIKDDEQQALLDQMNEATKAGSFEGGAIARYLPEVGGTYSKIGRGGLAGTADILAMFQVMKYLSGTDEGAARNLQNFLTKLGDKNTADNLKEDFGIDLRKMQADAEKKGLSYPIEALKAIAEAAAGNRFALGDMFPDIQANLGASALVGNLAKFDEIRRAIEGGSAGSVDRDWSYLSTTPDVRASQAEAARAGAYANIGEGASPFWSRARDQFSAALDRWFGGGEFAAKIDSEREAAIKAGNARHDAEVAAMWSRLGFGVDPFSAAAGAVRSRQLADRGGLIATRIDEQTRRAGELRSQIGPMRRAGDVAGSVELARQVREAEATIRRLQAEAATIGNPRQETTSPFAGINLDFGKYKARITGELGTDLGPAATSAMASYNSALEAEGAKAAAIAAKIAQQLKATLSFSASPTISPRFSGEGGGAAPTVSPTKATGGAAGAGGTTAHINIRATDPRAAGRETARAIARIGTSSNAMFDTATA